MGRKDPAVEKGLAMIAVGIVSVGLVVTIVTGSLIVWLPIALAMLVGFQAARIAK